MEPTSLTDLDELENAPTTYVSIREVSQLQSQQCLKTDCQNMWCPCRKE